MKAKNSFRFDLHTHTYISDGFLSPCDLVTYALKKIDGIAITDHDSVNGIEEALATGEKWNYPVIPGVELTTDYGGYEVHILGYFIDYRHPKLTTCLTKVAFGRLTRAKQIVAKLATLGYPVSWETVCAQAYGGFIGRQHIIRAMVASGLLSREQVRYFLKDYLSPGAPAYVPHEELTTEEAIRLILVTGGVPVLAHPGRIGNLTILPNLVDQGLAGIEIDYPQHSMNEITYYHRLASYYDLIPTGGSDFHGEPEDFMLGQSFCYFESVLALAQRASTPAAQYFIRIHSLKT